MLLHNCDGVLYLSGFSVKAMANLIKMHYKNFYVFLETEYHELYHEKYLFFGALKEVIDSNIYFLEITFKMFKIFIIVIFFFFSI